MVRGPIFLNVVKISITSWLKVFYEINEDFKQIWQDFYAKQFKSDIHIDQGFLSKGNRLCIPKTSLREFLINPMALLLI